MSRLQLDVLLEEHADTIDAVDQDHLRDELGSLLGFVDDTPPTPSAELAAVLGLPSPPQRRTLATVLPLHAGPARPRRRLTGPRGAVTGAVVLAAATVGATGISAAANSLPAPLQRRVADLSHDYLPFDFPTPRGALDRGPTSQEPPASGGQRPEPVAPPRDDARVSTSTTRGDVVVRRTSAPVDAVAGAPASGSPRTGSGPARPTAAASPSSGAAASAAPTPRPPGSSTSAPPRSSPSPGSEPRGDASTSPRRGSAPAGPTPAEDEPRPGHDQVPAAAAADAPDDGAADHAPRQGGPRPGSDRDTEQRAKDLREKEQREKESRESSGPDRAPAGAPGDGRLTETVDRLLDSTLGTAPGGRGGSLPTG
ncbi:hypothetical protein [Nocardioides aurantiacus]|uniref:hypothetical protein n=1 Tax=Nocardioides aurantiacus TaxID=86796 RepID=UPI00403F53FF